MRPEQRPSGRRPRGGEPTEQFREDAWEPSRDQAPPTETLSPTEAIYGYQEYADRDPRGGAAPGPPRNGEDSRYRESPYQETQWGAHPRWDGWEQQQRQNLRRGAAQPAGPPPGRRARGGGGAPPPGGPKRRLTLVIAVVAAVLVLGGGAGAYLMFFRGDDEPTAAPPATAPPEAPADQEQQPQQPAEPDPNRARIGVMPTEENTGVPAGVELEPHDGDLEITEDGAVVEGLDVEGCVTIAASDVTIRNTRVSGDCRNLVELEDEATGALLEDVELDGGGNPEVNGIGFSNYTLRRGHIHGVGDGAKIGDDTVIESTYINDLADGEDSHNDGVQASSGSDMVLRGNHIVNEHNQTAAVFIGADLGDIDNVLVEGNWLDGGGYTVYAGDGNEGEGTNLRFINNKFGRGAAHGPRTTEGDGIEWSGNVYSDGEEIPAPEPD